MRWPVQHWRKYRRVNEGAKRLDELMERLGVDPVCLARLDGGRSYAEARSNCIACRNSEACRRWFDASIVLMAPPVFCVNARTFAGLIGAKRARIA